ncbi:MAG: outer membrane protein assembly factor BamD, BamD/ComL family [Verrucomicrobiaceae bacterium]|nr:outer membrane protein assembly factor BamD, BamD/ComL family [Verrucomicrobiaceae bacterium]
MNAPAVSRFAAVSAALLFASGNLTPAWGFLDFFKKEQQKAPSASELQSQEAEASVLLREGKAAESAGSTGKATGIYDQILKKYPFTNSAAEAAFSKAWAIRQTGKLQPAFEAFQRLVNDFRQSPRFSDAIQQQYEVAEEAKGGKKQRTVIILPMKLGSEEVIKMYKQVITNAPYGKFAPLSQFSIAEIHQDKGEKNEAVAAYQAVVDNYPASKEAAEAQFRIGAISNIAAKKTQDGQNLTATRDALKTYVTTNPAGDRTTEAQTMLTQVDEAQAARSLEIGKFYEKQKKPKAAAIYYNEALKFGSADASQEARTRLSNLAASSPADVADTKRNTPGNDYTVPAAVDLRHRADYAGPPSPELARLSQKPKMRKDNDQFMPIPIQEPSLPTRADVPATVGGNSLLPPAAGSDKPVLLPVPPAPGANAPIPPPPAAEDTKKP